MSGVQKPCCAKRAFCSWNTTQQPNATTRWRAMYADRVLRLEGAHRYELRKDSVTTMPIQAAIPTENFSKKRVHLCVY